MAVFSDVTFAQDGGGNIKLHPYVVALVRWCVSCLWSTATVLLHRLVTAPLPPIAAPKPPTGPKPPTRPASSGHIRAEPLVSCQVLHQPPQADMDVVFVHGLYGSLENTWRQGDWRSKYKIGPNKVPLKRSSSIPTPCICEGCTVKDRICLRDENDSIINVNPKAKRSVSNIEFRESNENFSKANERQYFIDQVKTVVPNDEMFMTEKFYNNTLLNQVNIVDNYEMQAKFVRDLFKCENMCDSDMKFICDEMNHNIVDKDNVENGSKSIELDRQDKHDSNVEYMCECGESGRDCEVGCGCICDKCYSPCWPKDWLQVDFPNARIISINYTSDPYLWRPLWVKECKRLRLHERAEQMTRQLLDLGVGRKPVVWVGHSKGGLFIKQIYCEAYEEYLKTKEGRNVEQNNQERQTIECNECQNKTDSTDTIQNVDIDENRLKETYLNQSKRTDIKIENKLNEGEDYSATETKDNRINNKDLENDEYSPEARAHLWSNSTGFMFYSVPHRGSSLADIKTPITARSIELLEISKDNSLVLSLHSRWLRATEPKAPLVRSLVETNRTLMSVLWLRIVSVESADAGIGALCGISVDHREICKPSSRSCILYKELINLIHASVDRWRCNSFHSK
ncbi:uncharacterized protein LOC105388217 [Plutella xylostella]|uniref:uncharacterized protein LOC105388217 n=1 Tax=Plutella xylostella TaxID=51655 RepID=UPI002032C2EF|nr:uncharacterized protein LOC105388217 [Plutella xylostella]